MSDQWGRVPLSLLTSVSPSAVVLYACLAAHAHREHMICKLSNATLAERTGLSVATVKRLKRELIDGGWIECDSAQGRTHVPTYTVHLNRLTHEPVSPVKGVTSEPKRVSPVSHRTEVGTEVEQQPLRGCADESEHVMPAAAAEEPMFEIEHEERETPIGAACLAAFLDAYGAAPISRAMIGRLGKRFKELAVSYSRDELLAAAVDCGTRRVANVNAIEPFLLRARQPQQQNRDGWSRLAELGWADRVADV